jgi:branched-chain amino acid transport system substrate-binding protein
MRWASASTYECTDPLGCVDVGPGEPIQIAYALVISGADETLGVDSRNGIEVAMALKGQVLGHDIQLTGEDDGMFRGRRTGGWHQTFRQPVRCCRDRHILLQRGTCAVPLLSQAGFVIVSPSNTAPDLTLAGNENQHPGYFRTAHSDLVQGKAAASSPLSHWA